MKQKIIDYILKNNEVLLNRDFLVDLFTMSSLSIFEEGHKVKKSLAYKGKLFSREDNVCMATDFENYEISKYEILGKLKDKPSPTMRVDDSVKIDKSNLNCLYENIETTFGRLVANIVLIEMPFKGKVNFLDKVFDGSQLEKIVSQKTLDKEIDETELEVFVIHLAYLGNFELGVPVYTPKSLGVRPGLEKDRKEILDKYREGIDNKDVVAMSLAEQELVQKDKEYLKGDPSELFLQEKNMSVQRKKMYGFGGMSEKFGEKGFDFVEDSLEEGINKENFDIFGNEIRSGSFARALEVVNAGVQGKELTRIFQEGRIIEDDCGSKDYIHLRLTNNNYEGYKDRYFNINGELKILSDKDLKSYVNNVVKIRSPLTCKTKNGYCFTCMGGNIAKIRQPVLTMVVQEIAAFFLKASLKKSHGVASKTGTIDSLSDFTSIK